MKKKLDKVNNIYFYTILFFLLILTSASSETRFEKDLKKLSKYNYFVNSDGNRYELDKNIDKDKTIILIYSHGSSGKNSSLQLCKNSWYQIPPTVYQLDGFKITNKLKLDIDGKKAWFFHGDVFDVTMQHSRWITRLGGFSYDALIFLNSSVNRILGVLGRDKLSFSKTIKNKVKAAVAYINKFEDTVGEIAIRNGYDYVVCGHIHQPCIKTIKNKNGAVEYLNSGDWIENLTALEYNDKTWKIFEYDSSSLKNQELEEEAYKDAKELFSELVSDFNLDTNPK